MSAVSRHRPSDPLLRLPDVIDEVGLSKRTIYRKIGEGTFPPPRRIAKRAVAWPLSCVEAWKAEQPLATENTA